MSKKRIYEFARELNVESKEILQKAKEINLNFKSHMSSISDDEMDQVKAHLQREKKTVKNKNSENNGKKQSKRKQVRQDQQKKDNHQPNNRHENVKNKTHKNKKKPHNNKNQSEKKKKNKNRNKQKNNNDQSETIVKRTTNEQEKSAMKKTRRGQKNQSRQHRGIHGGPAGGRGKGRKKNKKQRQEQASSPKVPQKKLPDQFEYTVGMNIAQIAHEIGREPAELVKKLFMNGIMVTQNDSLTAEAIELLLIEYEIEPIQKVEIDETDFDTYFDIEIDEDKLVPRPATVTIMGHVDHGKTTLLDTLRETSVAQGEAGGITQHIGAYQLRANGELITFLDTPGHAAFTTMRARGADVTDIVIIVVAADDGVMPQTVEAINHAKAADVPIIVAVNKIDKPGANPDRVKQELMEYDLVPEEWGGDTIFVEISALFNQNIDELLEMITLVAEVQELKADPDRLALGTVLEARLDKSKGTIATVLVQQGTLRQGDPIVVGASHGRVRTMTNENGRRIKEAAPSTPVEITGLNETPQAGDKFVVFEDEKKARQIGEARAQKIVEEQRAQTHKITLDNLFESLEEGSLKEVNIIIKADVQGSVEALAGSLRKIEVQGVKINIIHTGVGAINESDVTLATASSAIIIGFNVRPTPQAKDSADREHVDIRTYRVIYDAIDEIEAAMNGMLDPEYEEQVVGHLTVREIYNVSKVGTIAGCMVNEGIIRRNSSVRLIRDGVMKFEGELGSLKRFENDASEVAKGYECGLTLVDYNDIKIDDTIEAFEMVEKSKVK